MTKTITMNIRMDKETRHQLQEFAGQVGLPASTLVKASIKQMLRNQQVTFGTALEPTPYLQKLIKEAEADYQADRNITTITNKAELEAFFNSL